MSPSTYSGSVKGGRIDITGNGLPSSWPSPLFSISMQSNSIPYDVEVISTSPTLMCLNVPEGVDGQVYDIVILTPREQEKTLTFTQTTADTPQVSLLTTVPAAAGMISVSLNRTTHSS